MNPPAFHASPNAPATRRRLIRGLTIGLAAAAVLAYVGAMGTWVAPLGERLAYWSAVILPGSLLGLAFTALVRGWGGLARHRWAEVALIALAVSVPHTFLVIVASALFFGIGAITPGLVGSFWAAVIVLALVLTAINHMAAEHPPAEPALLQPSAPLPTEAEVAATAPGLPSLPALIAEKLPIRLRSAGLLAIEAEDHYLRVHTDAGSDLVLMRMVDACTLLPESDGMRVHRSWWVAQAAVETRTGHSGKIALGLSGGLTVPVARGAQAAVRARGWG